MFLDGRHKSDFGEVGENGENGDLIWIFCNLMENWGQIPHFSWDFPFLSTSRLYEECLL